MSLKDPFYKKEIARVRQKIIGTISFLFFSKIQKYCKFSYNNENANIVF